MIESRKRNTILASISGILFSIFSMLMAFFLRKVFIVQIGVEHLGLFTFLSEIFGLLVAVDGGVCSSLFIKIYKPIAANDQLEIRKTYKLIKIVYAIRALLVFVIGSAIFFSLQWLATDVDIPLDQVKKAYLIYLLINSVSYLFIYNEFILESYQKRYITNTIAFIVSISISIINIVTLYLFSNFFLYLILQVLISLVTYVICLAVVKKRYPFLFEKTKLDKTVTKEVKEMFQITYYTLSDVIVKNTDNILITKFFGFTVNGIYSSYKMLNSQIFNLINKIKYSTLDSTREYLVSKDKQSSFQLLNNLTYLYFAIGGFCSVALGSLSTPFIILWLGSDYVMSIMPVFLTIMTLCVGLVVYPYEDAFYSMELYKRNKYVPIIEIAINLGVSIVLGLMWGISGIMIGTLAYLAFKTWYRVSRLCKYSFNEKATRVLGRMLYYFMAIIVTFAINWTVLSYIPGDNITSFIIKMLITAILPIALLILFTFRFQEFKWSVELFKGFANKLKTRRPS